MTLEAHCANEQPETRLATATPIDGIQKRKEDTRKKILIGAYMISKHEKNGTTAALLDELDTFLSRKQDRELFGLDLNIEKN